MTHFKKCEKKVTQKFIKVFEIFPCDTSLRPFHIAHTKYKKMTNSVTFFRPTPPYSVTKYRIFMKKFCILYFKNPRYRKVSEIRSHFLKIQNTEKSNIDVGDNKFAQVKGIYKMS